MKFLSKHPNFPNKQPEYKEFPNNKGYFQVIDFPKPVFNPDIESIVFDREEINYETKQFINHYKVIPLSQLEIESKLYSKSLNDGYSDATLNIKLKTTQNAQNLFSQLAVFIQLGLTAGVIDMNSLYVIWDFDDKPINITIGNLIGLLLRYGGYCKQLFDDYAP